LLYHQYYIYFTLKQNFIVKFNVQVYSLNSYFIFNVNNCLDTSATPIRTVRTSTNPKTIYCTVFYCSFFPTSNVKFNSLEPYHFRMTAKRNFCKNVFLPICHVALWHHFEYDPVHVLIYLKTYHKRTIKDLIVSK
jgi:hypothetical protein